MAFEKPAPLKTFTDASGNTRTAKDLPEFNPRKRWVPGMKYLVVKAVQAGAVTMEEMTTRYRLSETEFLQWQSDLEQFGTVGLRSTKVHALRKIAPRNA